MKKLTKLQYQVIFLYSKGLRFKEIDLLLATSSKGVYTQVSIKDKSRLTRAKISKEKNIKSFNYELKIYLNEITVYNKYFRNCSQWLKQNNTIPLSKAKVTYRNKFMFKCLDKSSQSYSRYKITFMKKYYEKVA